jgi:hypothetical protein
MCSNENGCALGPRVSPSRLKLRRRYPRQVKNSLAGALGSGNPTAASRLINSFARAPWILICQLSLTPPDGVQSSSASRAKTPLRQPNLLVGAGRFTLVDRNRE